MRRNVWPAFLLTILFVPAISLGQSSTPPEGILPVDARGKPLNLDFETGTLKDWKVEGEAFRNQPIKGDTVAPRRSDSRSQHQGRFWIGGYEKHGDQPQGTLTSVPFKVTHPWASFLVGGGAWPETCVELVRSDSKQVFSRTSGQEAENMERVAVDLRPVMGKEIFIRLVDHRSGAWGHINFDNFRFHAKKPEVPTRAAPASADVYAHAGLAPEEAARAMTVPEGFKVTLFAGEPDVHQPIAMCLDDRGRVWIAEAYSYPVRRKDSDAKDRILIFEDTNGDGKFDKCTVFMEGLNLISGLEVGFGGVWIGAAPNFMFVPMEEGADRPAGPPQILLDGWHYEDTHETLNDFTWGPDGWLYGCHGVFTHSLVGKPGTPAGKRIPINAGVWRYHPTKHIFEVFAEGTSNPWGLDFDAHGQAFIEACVIPHAFHMIQGGRFERQAGNHFNPYTYEDIKTIADHLHWQGANQWSGNSNSSSKGGGHAHCGLLIYQGGAWPEEFSGQLLMGNIHGHRFNMDILHAEGSGFVAAHGHDFLLANDAWARFINMKSGPDGNAYIIDWYDKQACHLNDINVWDRSNGRIYKLSYRGTQPVEVDLAKKSDVELAEFQGSENDWFARHARRLLQERSGKRAIDEAALQSLMAVASADKKETHRLRALWALHVCKGLHEDLLEKAMTDTSPYLRGWAIQLALENGSPSAALVKRLEEMAASDASPIVRLYLASGAQKLQPEQRWQLIANLLAHREDNGDHNLPCMYWYAAEPLAAVDPARALTLAQQSKVGLLLPLMTRRIAAAATAESLEMVLRVLSEEQNDDRRLVILHAINLALRGQRNVRMPTIWTQLSGELSGGSNSAIRDQALALSVTFGEARALASLRKTLVRASADAQTRHEALASLLAAKDAPLLPLLRELVKDRVMRGAAISALAAYDDPKTPELLIAAYPSLNLQESRSALNTLSSRKPYAHALLDAVAAKRISATAIPAEVVRQLRSLNDKAIDGRIAELWGIVRATPADRAKLIERWRVKITTADSPPDLALGRALFSKTCQQCHTLYGVGGKVGPDITGSNRADVRYLLENILDPSAVIPNEYKASVIALKSGRVITGIVRGSSPAALTVVTATETLTVPRDDIESIQVSENSMMPDDLLKPLSEKEVIALVSYLRHSTQVPLLATSENAKELFNGKDLTGWNGNPNLWKVENGEIVGTSPGIRRNEFLTSQMIAGDFRLSLKVKLVPNKENSGVQFHTEALPDGEVRGPQADVGEGWWGKLYEENGRGILSNNSGEKFVKIDDWNEYVIEAQGSHVRTFINGNPCVDVDDPKISRRGLFAFQIHAGGPMEVRFKDLKLEVVGFLHADSSVK